MSNDLEFRVVKSRKSRKKRNNTYSSHFASIRSAAEGGFPDQQVDIQTALRRINAAREDLEISDYYKSFLITLNESLAVLNNKKVIEIVCFGLGHVGECMISRYQLALALCIRDHFKVDCLVHDPIFYSDECRILESLKFNLITENEEGKHKIRSDGLTIIYLPHCPKQLTNNFLWENWGTSLKNAVLVCNSFTKLIESQPQRLLEESVPYILNICSYSQEFTLVNSFKYYDIFNDLSIHIFPESVLELITDNFWVNRGPEPSYQEQDIELISNSLVNKLKIKE